MKENNENEWGNFECLYKSCQAAITEGGFSTDNAVTEFVGENKSL